MSDFIGRATNAMKNASLTSALFAGISLALLTAGCQKTGRLSPELQARFDKERIAHRADDLIFRRTHVGDRCDSGWNDKRASIIVTHESVFIHVNGKPLVEITPRSTGYYEVHRDHDRIALHTGGGKSALSWSFYPPDDADSWTKDIRVAIKNAKSR